MVAVERYCRPVRWYKQGTRRVPRQLANRGWDTHTQSRSYLLRFVFADDSTVSASSNTTRRQYTWCTLLLDSTPREHFASLLQVVLSQPSPCMPP